MDSGDSNKKARYRLLGLAAATFFTTATLSACGPMPAPKLDPNAMPAPAPVAASVPLPAS